MRLFWKIGLTLCVAVAVATSANAQTEQARAAAPAKPKGATAQRTQNWMNKFYAVTLLTSFTPVTVAKQAKEFPNNIVYMQRADIFGKPVYYVRLGFFATFAEARDMKDKVQAKYPGAWATAVPESEQAAALGIGVVPSDVAAEAPEKKGGPSKGEKAPPAAALAPKAAGAPGTPGGVSEPPMSETEKQAGTLFSQGTEALTGGNYVLAIQMFNRLLSLPRNKFTADALEYVGVARERGGQYGLAQTQYENYLRLYPTGEGSDRVRQRLASMVTTQAAAPELRAAQEAPAVTKSVFGSLSQYYYQGAQKLDPTVGATTTDESLSSVTQRTLITNLDLTARFQNSNYDNRVIIRDQYTYSSLREILPNDNRLFAAYMELKDKRRDYMFRLGRQPGAGGGVLGRFDGAMFTYNFSPRWHFSVVSGVPNEYEVDASRYFYGANLDLGPIAQHWYGNLYFIKQMANGIIDREAVGTELRYFEPRHSVYTLLDYDISYSVLNTAVVQINWQTEGATSFNLLMDQRRSPPMQTVNVLNGATINVGTPVDPVFVPITSFNTMLSLFGEENVRTLAELRTPQSNYYDVNVTHPLSPKFQIAGGVKMYNFTATPATILGEATAATPNTYSYTVQGIGTGLLFLHDVSVLSLIHTRSDIQLGNAVSFTNRTVLRDNYNFDLGLRFAKNENYPDEFTRSESEVVTPMVKLGYRLRQAALFEVEVGQERTRTKNVLTGDERVDRTKYFSLGYRWNF
jgi:hypothetical protein